MSAEILRRAAAQARSDAETHRVVAPHLREMYGDDCGSERQALRDLAVADWLEHVAQAAEKDAADGWQMGAQYPGLTVARTYLGENA